MSKQYDNKQLEAIRFNNGYALVLGAPGCGKTDILSKRVAFARQIGRIEYKDMLCLTFTNRASREMRDRIKADVGDVSGELFVGNIHRFCIRFLYENNIVPIDTGIADDTDQEELLMEAAGSVKPLSGWQINAICDNSILIFLEQFDLPLAQSMGIKPDQKFRQLAQRYIKLKEENKLIDYDDILLLAYAALKSGDTLDYKYSSYKWIQVDEVQDLNPLQLAIVELLVARDYSSVVYLGDERQAIYSFIGARAESIAQLRQKAGDNVIVLPKNYRSPKYMLDMLNSYAINQLGVNPELLPVTSNLNLLNDPLVLVNCAFREQQYDVVSAISRNLYFKAIEESEKTGKDMESTGILVRTNADADKLSDMLLEHGIKHIRLSKKDSFKMVNFKTVHSHFSVVANDTRFSDWTRLLYQTRVLETLSRARGLVKQMRDIGLTPLDLMNYDRSSYYIDFCDSYRNKEIVIFDTETTGLDIFNDDIVQIAAMKIRDGVMVAGSEVDIVIQLDDGKIIPPSLQHGVVNPMVDEYARRSAGCSGNDQYFMTAQDAFSFFIDYIGDDELLGHNVNYDVHILQNNVIRRTEGISFVMPAFWDTLKMSRMLDPNLRRHNLKSLLEIYGLEGVNSHNALDDIRGTKSLTDYCYAQMSRFTDAQGQFLSHPDVIRVQARLQRNYLPLYRHTFDKLYSPAIDDEHTFDFEFTYVYDEMVAKKYISAIRNFQYMRLLFDKVVINRDKDKYFNHQLVNHLYELRTFNEGDFFQNDVLKEKLFIMTIHKSKGLEFDNVIAYDISSGRIPHYKSTDTAEDARVLYVAMSRARKRLYITYDRTISPFIGDNPEVKKHFAEMSEEKKRAIINLENIGH